MGYGPLRRLITVELPLATPVIIAGLRVGVVSSVSLASVGQIIGVSSLGYLFIDGMQRDFPTEIYVGLFLRHRARRGLRPDPGRRPAGAHAVGVRPEPGSGERPRWVLTQRARRGGGGARDELLQLRLGLGDHRSANWHGSGSIPQQLVAHLGYSGLPLLIAALIAIPLGVLIGHTGRGAVVVVNLANAWRAIPTLGLLILLAVYFGFTTLDLADPARRAGDPADPGQRLRGRGGRRPRRQGRGQGHGHDARGSRSSRSRCRSRCR